MRSIRRTRSALAATGYVLVYGLTLSYRSRDVDILVHIVEP